ncbi:hypothetical protein Q8F55_005166 [Vanrija albida]|uniref:FAD-binding domain-containing protein n=1 Tax=Vanrija albida TaxID=181172 RepID=A0ABR3Q164_9TREE
MVGIQADTERRARIAILGAGYAGATAAIALQRLGALDISVFDGASALREVGASIGLQACALRALDKLGLGDAVEEIAYRHGSQPLTHRHWKTGEVQPTPLPDPLPEERHQMARFARAHLHQLLLSRVEAPVQVGKRAKEVVVGEEGVRVTFADGTTWEGDAVIGADGIHSATRKAFYPDFKIDPGNGVTLRGIFDASLLEGTDGVDLPKESCHWLGPDRAFFTSPLKRGLYAHVAFLPNHLIPSVTREWDATTDIDYAALYAHWYPPLAALTRVAPEVRVFPDYNGPALPSLVVGGGRGVLLGDAGHCHGGAFAAGGTLAIEDAYTLGLAVQAALERARARGQRLGAADLAFAFDLFDKARLAHVNRLLRAANDLRKAKKHTEGQVLTEEDIEAYVHRHVDISWVSDNDADAVFAKVLAEAGGV